VGFLGIDLAWSARNRTGLAVVEDDGALRASGVAVSDDEIAAWLQAYAGGVEVVAVDAPLVVPNASGMREAERAIQRTFGRYDAGAYPSHRGNLLFDPPRAETLAGRFGWTADPSERGSVERPVCLEVYPHPAMVVLFGLERVLPYKAGRGRTPDARRATFLVLLDHLERLPELALTVHPRWTELRAMIGSATRQMHLEAVEDEIDAIVCAHLAWLWRHRPGALVVYGSFEAGYVVAPPAPR
jgi:predicted RNase H-like nuclease